MLSAGAGIVASGILFSVDREERFDGTILSGATGEISFNSITGSLLDWRGTLSD